MEAIKKQDKIKELECLINNCLDEDLINIYKRELKILKNKYKGDKYGKRNNSR